MEVSQLIQTYNMKLMELRQYGRHMPSQEIQARQQELNQLKQQIDYLMQQPQQSQPQGVGQGQGQGQMHGVGQPQNQAGYTANNFVNKEPKHSNIENFIGKNIMAVVASLLIFVSIIVLCGAVIPFLNDVMKTVLIFTVSTLITLVGCFMLYRKKSAWSITLASCGLCAIYISALVSNIYLKTFNQWALYGVTLIWVMIATFLSKKYSSVFSIICWSGLTISMMLNSMDIRNITETRYYDGVAVVVSPASTVTVFIVAYTLLVISGFNSGYKNIAKDIFATIFLGITNATFNVMVHRASWTEENSYTFAIAILISVAVYVIYSVIKYKKYEVLKYDFGFSLNTVIQSIMATSMANTSCRVLDVYIKESVVEQISYWIAIVMCTAFAIMAMMKFRQKIDATTDIIKELIITIPLISAACVTYTDTYPYYFISLVPFVALMGYLGFKWNNTSAKIISLIIFFIEVVAKGPTEYWKIVDINTVYLQCIQLVASVVTLMILLVFIQYYKEQYKGWFKGITLLMGTIGISLIRVSYIDFEFNYTRTVVQWSIALILTILMIYTFLGSNPVTKEKDKGIDNTFRIFSEVAVFWLMIEQLANWGTPNIKIQAVMLAVINIAFASINMQYCLNHKYKEYLSLANIFKFTLVFWMETLLLFHIGYVLSTASIVVAIIGIVLGFKFKLEYIRIYGLILSIIGIIKISLIDIHLKGSLGTAICLFVCGVLCFCISFVYNRLDKVIGGKAQ